MISPRASRAHQLKDGDADAYAQPDSPDSGSLLYDVRGVVL